MRDLGDEILGVGTARALDLLLKRGPPRLIQTRDAHAQTRKRRNAESCVWKLPAGAEACVLCVRTRKRRVRFRTSIREARARACACACACSRLTTQSEDRTGVLATLMTSRYRSPRASRAMRTCGGSPAEHPARTVPPMRATSAATSSRSRRPNPVVSTRVPPKAPSAPAAVAPATPAVASLAPGMSAGVAVGDRAIMAS